MTIRARTAKRVCNQSEYSLFADSRRPILQGLNVEQLRQRVVKTRKLRDNARQLEKKAKAAAKGQVNTQRSKAAKRYDTALRRVEVFEEVCGRFERRLAKLLKDRTTASKQAGGKRHRHVEVRRKLTVKPSARPKRVTKSRKAKQARIKKAANDRIAGHVSSRDRRQQLRQDRKR